MVRVILLAILVSLASDENVVAIRGNDFDIDISGAYYIVDETKCTVRKVSSKGDVVARIGGPGWDNDRFDQPAGIWARNGLDVFVADYGNHRIQRFDRDLSFVSSFSTRESGKGLGLHIVERLCREIGVGFSLESREGSGTTAVVRMPRAT